MGDGIFDSLVFDKVGYSIAPNNADSNLKKKADYVTERAGGDRAVAEACLNILEVFFEPYVQNQKILFGKFMQEILNEMRKNAAEKALAILKNRIPTDIIS